MAKSKKGNARSGSVDIVMRALVSNNPRHSRLNFLTAQLELKDRTHPSQLIKLAKRYSGLPRFRELICCKPFAKNYDQIRITNFEKTRDFLSGVTWLAVTAFVFSKDLNIFLKLRNSYTKHFLLGEYDVAEKILSAIEDQFGVSIWLIEARMSLLQTQVGLEAQKSYLNRLLAVENIPANIKYLAFMLSTRTEQSITWKDFEILVEKSLTNINPALRSYLLYRLSPLIYNYQDNLQTVVEYEINLPLIDQYTTLVHLLKISLISSREASLDEIFNLLITSLEDPDLRNMRAWKGERDLGMVNPVEHKMLCAYDSFLRADFDVAYRAFSEVINERPDLISAYELAITSFAKCNNELPELDNVSIKNRLINLVVDIVYKTRDCKEVSAELVKLGTVFFHQGWSYGLLKYINRDFNSAFTAPKINSRLHYLTSGILSPLTLWDLVKHNDTIYAQCLAELFPQSEYVKLSHVFLNEKYADLEKQIEAVRSTYGTLFRAAYLLKSMDGKSAEVVLLENFPLSDEPRRLDEKVIFLFLLERNYYLNQQPERLIKMIAENCVLNENLYAIFHMTNAQCAVEANIDLLKGQLETAIFLDIYSKYVSSDKDVELREAYEDVLDRYETIKPSEIVDFVPDDERDELIYFLSSICTISNMSSVGHFNKLKDVQSERISINQVLIKLDPDNEDKYRSEIKDITKTLMIEEGIRTVDKSKIYVNIDGIKSSVKPMKERFNRMKDLIGVSVYDQIIHILASMEDGGKKQPHMKFANEALSELLIGMFIEIRDEFVASNKHGLDGYLSVGIRHGTLLGKLRTPFQDESLITKRDKDTGVYKEATYWADIYQHLPQMQINSLLSELAEFSRQVDNIIEYIQDTLFQIRTEKQNLEGLFNFDINQVNFIALKNNITSETTFESFVDSVLDVLWQMTEKGLVAVKEIIDSEIKAKFNALFNSTIRSIKDVVHDSDVYFIENRINHIRTKILNELDAVANWFQLSKISTSNPYDIALIIDIGVAIAKNLSNKKILSIDVVNETPIQLRGDSLKYLVEIVNIVLDNASKHHGYENDLQPKVKVSSNLKDGFINIIVENTISESVDIDEVKIKLRIVNEKLSQDLRKIDDVRSEGGTGFLKIKKMIEVDLRSNGSIIAEINPGVFVTKISIWAGGLLHESASC